MTQWRWKNAINEGELRSRIPHSKNTIQMGTLGVYYTIYTMFPCLCWCVCNFCLSAMCLKLNLTFLEKTEFTKPGQGTWFATRKSRQQRLTASFKTVCDCISLSFSTSSILKESGLVATFLYKQTALNHQLYIMPKHPIIIACRPQIFPQVLRYPTKPEFCQHGLATHHQFRIECSQRAPI